MRNNYFYSSLTARGATSLSGNRWVRVKFKGRKAWLRYSMFVGSCGDALHALADRGVVISGAPAANHLAKQVHEIHQFPDSPIIDSIGWNGPHFALPDGTVLSPHGSGEVEAVFSPNHGKCEAAGTLEGWRDGVASPLTGQSILMFAVMLAFMPPLLQMSDRFDNPGFELVGAPGIGKSTAQQLACSVLGNVSGSAGYGITFDTTLNALETQMPIHADLPMILDEASLFFAGETAAKRGAMFKAFAFRMSGGRGKERLNVDRSGEHRFCYFSSSNESLMSLIGSESDVARAAGDRLITLAIAPTRPFGIFDRLPRAFESANDFAHALISAASINHGHAIRVYLSHLVRARAQDEDGLRSSLQKWLAAFRKRAGVDLNSGSDVRVADAFGLVYAAGRLAKDFGVLPSSWRCGPAVLTCYREHLKRQVPQRRFEDRLEAAAALPDVVLLKKGAAAPSGDQIRAGHVFVRCRPSCRELIVRNQKIRRLFSDWDTLVRRPDVQALLVRDGKHLTTRRTLIRGSRGEDVLVFRLPPEQEEEEESDG